MHLAFCADTRPTGNLANRDRCVRLCSCA
jgi:hypothetical protein